MYRAIIRPKVPESYVLPDLFYNIYARIEISTYVT